MIIPIYIGVEILGWGIYACWITLTLYVLTLFSVSLLRYRQGKWKAIRLIRIGDTVD
jgi:Na+-driven multidrug efflux pump